LPRISTYYIKSRYTSLDDYYKDIDEFSRNIIEYIIDNFNDDIIKLKLIDEDNKQNITKDKIIYAIYFLTFGVIYKVYIKKAYSLNENIKRLIKKNLTYDDSLNKMKPKSKKLKGYLSTIFLLKEVKHELIPNIDSVGKLISYLELTCEFDGEIKIIKLVYKYIKKKYKNISAYEFNEFINRLLNLAIYFDKKAEESLNKYTNRVSKFLLNFSDEHKYKDDILYIKRETVEYHLNMVFACIINDVLRDDFKISSDKILIMPTCMKIKNNFMCRAKKKHGMYICSNCDNKCKINELSKLGKYGDFNVYTVKNKFQLNRLKLNNYKNKGVAVASCVLNIINIYIILINLEVIPNLILLDYCGCKKHWCSKDNITNFNIQKFFDYL
jgi:uncharacterized protein